MNMRRNINGSKLPISHKKDNSATSSAQHKMRHFLFVLVFATFCIGGLLYFGGESRDYRGDTTGGDTLTGLLAGNGSAEGEVEVDAGRATEEDIVYPLDLDRTVNTTKIALGKTISVNVIVSNSNVNNTIGFSLVETITSHGVSGNVFEYNVLPNAEYCSKTNTGYNCVNVNDIANYISLAPQSTFTLEYTLTAKAVGTATLTGVLSASEGQSADLTTTVEALPAIVEEVILESECTASRQEIDAVCALKSTGIYSDGTERTLPATSLTYVDYEPIGTLQGNEITITKAGTAIVSARYEEIQSNGIEIRTMEPLQVGLDTEGEILRHFAARISGNVNTTKTPGANETTSENAAPVDVVAQYNTIIFTAHGGSEEVYDWSLDDTTYGVLSGDGCTDGNVCTDRKSVTFRATDEIGTTNITITDPGGETFSFSVHVFPPAIAEIRVLHADGSFVTETTRIPKGQDISFEAELKRADGTLVENVATELEWEFRTPGGDWVSQDGETSISGGVFSSDAPGLYSIRAKKAEQYALPGIEGVTSEEEMIYSDIISIEIQSPVGEIESMRLAGNEGLAEGTTDTLYLRLSHFGGMDDLHDIELNLLEGRHIERTMVTSQTNYFSINLVSEEILQEAGADQTYLFTIPFEIPILGDLHDGPHTLEVILHNVDGTPEGTVYAYLPIYIGRPQSGDANLDGKVNLLDAVLIRRFEKGTLDPTLLQLQAVDEDLSGMVTLSEVLFHIKNILASFLEDYS